MKIDRARYIRKKRALALRQPVWARLEWSSLSPDMQSSFQELMGEGSEAHTTEVYKFQGEGAEYLEFHVDFLGSGSRDAYDTLREELGKEGGWYSVRFHEAAAASCEHFHDPGVCKCNRQILHVGQDESIYKAYAREGNEWVIRGVRGLRRKTEGPGEMVSAWQDEQRGFGLVVTKEELKEVNEFREQRGRRPLKESPGTRFLVHGKNKEGFWGYEQFEKQVVDVLDVLEVLYPDKQLVLEVDHSSGHAKYRPDGLHVSNMNVKYGGKQKELRDSVMTEGCLGPREAKMYLNKGKWSTEFVAGETTSIVDLKPQLGKVQRIYFGEGCPPPFYACDAPEQDVRGMKVPDRRGRTRKLGTRQKMKNADGRTERGEGTEEKKQEEEKQEEKEEGRKNEKEKEGIVREGYLGKPKGMKQILWERGWFIEGMSTAADVKPEMDLERVLSAQPDFKDERPALQHLVESRGHILLLSPKYHPEIAGVGIEFSWGMSKMKFRREINDEIPAHLHHNMVASMCPRTILTLRRVRRFARRTRDYCRAYHALEKGGEIESKSMIEKMKKDCKAHRNILDMELSALSRVKYRVGKEAFDKGSGRLRSDLPPICVGSMKGDLASDCS